MIVNKLLKISLIILSVVYIGFEILQREPESTALRTLFIFLLAFFYIRTVDQKEKLFLWFLFANGIGHLLDYLSGFIITKEEHIVFSYYLVSYIYIISYALLVLLLFKKLTFKRVISKHYITIGVLLVLNIFSVTLISETTAHALTYGENITEFIYSAVVIFLLSVALINYMDKNDNKSMLFLIGSICIFFSEMIQLAYLYISDLKELSALYSITFVLALGLYYMQSRLEFEPPIDYFSEIS